MDLDLKNWTRQTYSTFDWLGDVGGLYSLVFILASYVVSPMAKHAVQVAMLSKFFRLQESQKTSRKTQVLRDQPASQTQKLQ